MTGTTSLTEKAAALYQGEALAPMVRASTTPLRTLAINYGADFVYTEELVDRSLSSTVRMENKVLNTIDYVKDTRSLSKKVQRRLAREGNAPALMLRIDPEKERGKLVCQIGKLLLVTRFSFCSLLLFVVLHSHISLEFS